MQDEETKGGERAAAQQSTIEVPLSVIQRFFSKKEVLTAFLKKINKENTHNMLDDLCATYQFNDQQTEELTELAYIFYESFKDSLVQADLVKLLGKWKTLSFVHLLTYLDKMH